MSVQFVEGREFPKQLSMDGYGDTGSDIANIGEKISPWDFLTGIFVTKPAQAQAAQVALAQTQAATAVEMQQEADMQKQATMRTLLMAGAGIAGLIVVAMILRPHPPRSVAGYRKRRSKKRSRR